MAAALYIFFGSVISRNFLELSETCTHMHRFQKRWTYSYFFLLMYRTTAPISTTTTTMLILKGIDHDLTVGEGTAVRGGEVG